MTSRLLYMCHSTYRHRWARRLNAACRSSRCKSHAVYICNWKQHGFRNFDRGNDMRVKATLSQSEGITDAIDGYRMIWRSILINYRVHDLNLHTFASAASCDFDKHSVMYYELQQRNVLRSVCTMQFLGADVHRWQNKRTRVWHPTLSRWASWAASIPRPPPPRSSWSTPRARASWAAPCAGRRTRAVELERCELGLEGIHIVEFQAG